MTLGKKSALEINIGQDILYLSKLAVVKVAINHMKTLTPETRRLLEKLKMAEEIYQRASDMVHNPLMTKVFQKLAQRKSDFLTNLSVILDIDDSDIQLRSRERLRVELEKIRQEIDNILLRLNEGEVLHFCIKREYELISMYHNVLSNISGNQFFKDVVVSQLQASNKTVETLETKLDKHQ